MKKIFAFFIFIFSFASLFAQPGNDTTKYTYFQFPYGNKFNRIWGINVLEAPHDTSLNKYGIVRIDTSLYIGNGIRWVRSNGGTTGSPGTNPFADNTALVKNNADNTKLAILSAASISTATTRTYTLPDANMTFNSTNTAQTISAAKTYSTAPIFSFGTATRPLKIDGSKNVITGLIDVSSANDITGQLPLANIANVADLRLLGNYSGGVAPPQPILTDATIHKVGTNIIGVDTALLKDTIVFTSPLTVSVTGDTVRCPTCITSSDTSAMLLNYLRNRGTNPQIGFFGTSPSLTGDDQFVFDAANHAVRLGTAATGSQKAFYLKVKTSLANVVFTDTFKTITGNTNTGFGYGVFNNLTSGNSNAAFGWNALKACTTCAFNVAIAGSSALNNCTDCGGNFALGASLPTIVHGSGNISVGGAMTGDLSNTIAIDPTAAIGGGIVTVNDQAVFGDTTHVIFLGLGGKLAVPSMAIEGGIYYDLNSGTYMSRNSVAYIPIGTEKIITTSSNTTLNQFEGTVVLTSGTPTVTLPAAASWTNKKYIIVNQTGGARTISSYLDFSGAGATTVAANSSISIQSDGTNWYRIQ